MADASAFAYAGVAAIGAAFRDGSLSPRALVEAALARLDRLEPRLNAVIDPLRDLAFAMAARAQDELKAGRDRGPLHGIPVAIKDIIDIEGVPTGYATRALDPALPEQDAALVARLRAAGAVFLGKTNLLEFAYGIAHPALGQTNNPFDTGRTSGGSSGGSAALVSAGIVPLAVGTDTGGSIRIPAAYCGIVGLKPSYGAVSTQGVFPLSWSLDHAGPLARSVADAAFLLGGLTGSPVALAPRRIEGLRIGLLEPHLASPLVRPGVSAAVEAAVARLVEAGATARPVSFEGHERVSAELIAILHPEASLIHEPILARRPEGYAPGTRAQVEAGFGVPATDYVRAQRFRAGLTETIEALFAEFDVLLSPSVAFVSPIEDPAIGGEDGDAEGLSSGLANMTGQPAISLPCGLSEGLPVGLQLMGRRGDDAGLLSAAAAVEAVLGFTARPAL
ncbi:amidase [Labrys monachus]|uniref:Indoleacetamide hydrolase n=1 Tax=Labrys monachus TaxID=217067 RepID=A0ABU0FCI0_9HYPH|nr:amidase [Labrys monachus]MDQ0392042.1 aspartyl-tRNA(Asn)/glutamyl-tRNA(Gln) amidotransferase subunit A [Labrys monachus]